MIIKAVLSLNARVDDLPKKEDVRAIVDGVVEEAKEEILGEVRPIAKAVDKDAVMVVSHEKRIMKIEKHLLLSK